MIVGHAAVAFAANAKRSRIPLATLLAATYLPDLVEALVPGLATGPRSENWSHALTSVSILAALSGIAWLLYSQSLTDAWIVGAVILSHWFLDAIVSLKPIWPGGPVTGLLLYDRSPLFGLAAEICVIAAAWAVIRRSDWSTRKRRGVIGILLATELLATGVLLTHQWQRLITRDQRTRTPTGSL